MNISLLSRICFAMLMVCVGLPSQAQQAKGPLQLADQYFAAGEYYTAAHLYGQFLHPAKKQSSPSDFPLIARRRRAGGTTANVSKTDVRYKQAESYRLANYWQEAADAYDECADKDSVKFIDAKYWQAVCERSLGHYAAAKDILTNYLSNGIAYKDAAVKELATLQYIAQQLSRADTVLTSIRKLDASNSGVSGVFAPVHLGGNQFLISSTEADSVTTTGVNPYHSRLFYASLNEGRLDGMVPVQLPVTNARSNQGAASLSADGNILYFSQWRIEKGGSMSSIYYSVKQAGGWGSPTLLRQVNREGSNSKQPFCTKDGKYIFFASDRSGGAGKFDIWYALLNKDGSTGEPINAGTMINTAGDEQAPFYHNSSNTLVFSSNGRQGMGGYDLFESKGYEANWQTPSNLGHPVNSARDDVYFFAQEAAPLLSNAIFSSDRGAGCCLETYMVSKKAKSRKLSGVLRDCNDNTPVADADVKMKDATGKNWVTKTDANGNYQFDLGANVSTEFSISINKELYKDTISAYKQESVDQTDLLTDKFTNASICIDKKPVFTIKAEDVVTVFFDFDKSILKPAAVSKLDSIYTVMLENPAATIQISGYTDGRGTEAYNKILSDKRAKACADYLAKKGIETTRISFMSFGACCPIEMELINGRDNADGRSRNRRALINVKKD